MDYLNRLTKSNTKLINEMIALYLEQTPVLVESMRTSFKNKEWSTFQSSVHKMIPSFSIMGFPPQYEEMARTLQAYEGSIIEQERMSLQMKTIEAGCNQACIELKAEYNRLDNL